MSANRLDEIIDLLGNAESDLNDILMKTKIFLFKSGQKKLSPWVSAELNGYPNEQDLPDYRIVSARILINANNAVRSYKNFQIPLTHLDDEMYNDAYKSEVRLSISSIQELVDNAGDSFALQQPIPLEFSLIYAKHVDDSYEITKIYKEIALHQFTNILSQVRSRLLDFLLEFSDQVDQISGTEAMEDKAKKIDASSLFQNAVLKGNVTINVGDGNSFNINNNIIKNDFSALHEKLSQLGISEDEISELKESIHIDGPLPPSDKKYGAKVNEWFAKMIQKAANSTWNISVAAAAPVLTNALNQFFGF